MSVWTDLRVGTNRTVGTALRVNGGDRVSLELQYTPATGRLTAHWIDLSRNRSATRNLTGVHETAGSAEWGVAGGPRFWGWAGQKFGFTGCRAIVAGTPGPIGSFPGERQISRSLSTPFQHWDNASGLAPSADAFTVTYA